MRQVKSRSAIRYISAHLALWSRGSSIPAGPKIINNNNRFLGNMTIEYRSTDVIHMLHRAGQCADELFALNMGQNSLTPRQFEVLKAVHSNRSPSQTALVGHTGIDRSTLADIVRRLVERGLLERRRTRRDARMYEVNITGEGETVLAAAAPVAQKTTERLLAGLTEAERDVLAGALAQIVSTAKSES